MKTAEFSVVGTRPIRPDGADKVTGRAVYGADLRLPGMLYGAVLRSPHAHARILRIDVSKALALDGVKAVVTAADFPQTPDRKVDLGEGDVPLSYLRGNILASGKALYKGHAVAAVAAVSAHVAEEAAELIEVDYEALPHVLTAPEAMAPGAPVILENLKTEGFAPQDGAAGNISEHLRHELGDVAKGFAEADVIVEREFHTSTVHQGYIEPQNATALWNNDGRVHIWTSTQGAFPARDVTAMLLDLPVSRIKVTPMEIGGGFGGKISVYLEPVAAMLSRKAGRPVRVTMTRRDVFEGTGPSGGSAIRVKVGAHNDGRIVAAQAWMAYESGAFPFSNVVAGSICILASYDIPNVVIDGYGVIVNKPSTNAYRAPGATNAGFAAESVIDEVAEKLGADPLAFRLQNAAREGSRRADGARYPRIGCVEVLEAMRDHPHYQTPLEGPNRGRGVAVGFWMNAGLASSCTIAVNADGVASLVEGSTDIGGSRASIAMQAAEVLGLPAERVQPSVVDTDSIGFTHVTGGSRTTFATGWAAYEAARDVVRQMKERAAILLDAAPADVSEERGVYRAGERSLTFAEIAAQLDQTGGPVVGRGTVNPPGVGGSFAGLVVDVEVDPETGKVTVLRATSVQDAGRAIHPSYVEGQMQGGTAQGIGWALNEEYFMNAAGAMANSSFLDYRMPVALDLPMIDTVIVEVPNPGHPFGVRGVGEANIVPPPGALANAIYRATGVRMSRLPMNPCAVLEAVWSRG
jgi:CO/xanthine dehydrogenase Mo-binding subunit